MRRGLNQPMENGMTAIGAELQINNLSKVYPSVLAVDDFSLQISSGEFLTLLGPSGSGKTTVLMMIAGFVTPTTGSICINNQNISDLPPFKRGIGMTFQNYALFPHKTVYENIAFPLRMRKMEKSQIDEKVESVLVLVKLAGFQKRYPKQLSGGQQQRIALARALVFNPPILLMDEPLGALDKKLREHMQLEVKQIQQALELTVVYVTHDQEEALTMSDRIVILNHGKIEQIGTPETIYEEPASEFVADFIGESNLIEGTYLHDDEAASVIETSRGSKIKGPRGNYKPKEQLKLVIRPEKVFFVGESMTITNNHNITSGVVEEIIYVGETTKYRMKTAFIDRLTLKRQNVYGMPAIRVGDEVKIGWTIQDTRVV